MEKHGSNASQDANVDFIFKLCNYEVRSHITPLSSNGQESHKHTASAPIFLFKYAFMTIHFVYDEKCRKKYAQTYRSYSACKRQQWALYSHWLFGRLFFHLMKAKGYQVIGKMTNMEQLIHLNAKGLTYSLFKFLYLLSFSEVLSDQPSI